ncbi:DUF6737 family protein [Baaleninema sp.]|uniref:DUF6737 family protein n=1 Tax=Baaleninema sp. TaxID=3101197 RepID=UPI003D02B095
MSDANDFNIWKYKPWWCQPWSILLTGIAIIAGSWLMFHRFWLTGLVAVPILVWMAYFLLLFPRLVAKYGGLREESDE